RTGLHRLLSPPDLHVRSRGRLQVPVPERIVVGAAFRRDHDVPVAGARIEERRRARLARLATSRRQQQDRGLAHPPAHLAAGRAIDGPMDAPEQPEAAVGHAMSTLITFVEPGRLTCVPAVITTRSPASMWPASRAARTA